MAQQIRELMPPHPVALPGTASVHEAARAMRDAEIGDVMVLEHHQVCGMVTDRDIVVRLVAEAQDPATTTLADLCSHTFVTVRPTDTIVEGGQAVGMVSLGDLAVAREPHSALGESSAAPSMPHWGQAPPPPRRQGRRHIQGRNLWRK
jgi:CBS domain-containing protein